MYVRERGSLTGCQYHQLEVFAAPFTLIAESLAGERDPFIILYLHFLTTDGQILPQICGRRRKPKEDLNIIRNWFHTCVQHHGIDCEPSRLSSTDAWPSDLKLI